MLMIPRDGEIMRYNGPINTDEDRFGGADKLFFTYIYSGYDKKNITAFKDEWTPKRLCASAPKF